MILLGLWHKQYLGGWCEILGCGKKIGEGKEELEPLPEFLEEKSHYNPPLASTVSRVSMKQLDWGCGEHTAMPVPGLLWVQARLVSICMDCVFVARPGEVR
jgi:hypothetical protein